MTSTSGDEDEHAAEAALGTTGMVTKHKDEKLWKTGPEL